jgi:hypothetical protein
MTEIRLSRFSSSPVLSVAGRLGILADYDVELTETIVGSSREQFADLAAGKYDAPITSCATWAPIQRFGCFAGSTMALAFP